MRIYSLLICANCNHQRSQPHPEVTWWPWNPEMGQELWHLKLPLEVQSCLRDLPGKWDRISISSWLTHLLMGWKCLSFFNSIIILTRADQIQHNPVWQLLLLTVLSSLWRESSLSCRDGDPPPCVAPSVHHTHPQILNFCLLVKKWFLCCQWRAQMFYCLSWRCSVVSWCGWSDNRDSSRLVWASCFSRFCFLCICACCV